MCASGFYAAAQKPREQPEKKTSSGRNQQGRGDVTSACAFTDDYSLVTIEELDARSRSAMQRPARGMLPGSTNPRPTWKIGWEVADVNSAVATKTSQELRFNYTFL